MAHFKFAVYGQILDLLTPTKGISDNINANSAEFDFRSPDWADAIKIAHFSNPDYEDGADVPVLLENDQIPASIGLNLPAGIWDVYLHGDIVEDDEVVQRLVTETQSIQIVQSGISDDPVPIEPSVGEQILAIATRAYNARVVSATAEVTDPENPIPSASVEITGPNGEKNLGFTFSGLRDVTAQAMIADEFYSSPLSPGAYDIGDYVRKDGVLYRFIADHIGAWDSNYVVVATIGEDLADVIRDTNDNTTNIARISGMIAPIYDSVHGTYDVGDYVSVNNFLFRCTTAIETPEEWTPAHWTAVKVVTELIDISQYIDSVSQVASDTYDALAQGYRQLVGRYDVDDYVTHDGKVYRCITAITVPEVWTPAHWQEVTIGEELKNLTDPNSDGHLVFS